MADDGCKIHINSARQCKCAAGALFDLEIVKIVKIKFSRIVKIVKIKYNRENRENRENKPQIVKIKFKKFSKQKNLDMRFFSFCCRSPQ